MPNAAKCYSHAMNLKHWLLYITNNEEDSRNEETFDIAFFLINTMALIIGSLLLFFYNEPAWIAFLVIEYTWALDNMRHNRD